MSATSEATLQMPGVNLYYQVRGTGPVLLILQGGDGDAEGTDGIAGLLASHYTVVTYDRRGLSRSKLADTAATPKGLEPHVDDARHLLAALAAEPAFVLGFSLGALLGLELVSRHPELIRLLVAHEPPAMQFLPEAERAQANRDHDEVEAAYRSGGVGAAMRLFVAKAGLDFANREEGVELPRPKPDRVANLEFFLAHDVPAVRRHELDLKLLLASPTRIVPAGGQTSRQFVAYRCAEALANRLGSTVTEFPGGHNGFVTHPMAFTERLRGILSQEAAV